MEKEKLHDIADKVGRTIGRFGKKASQIYDTAAAKVEEHGGLGEMTQEYAETGGKRVGSAVGHAAKFVDGMGKKMKRIPRPGEIYAEGQVDVQGYAAKGQEIGARIGEHVRTGASRAKQAASELSDVVMGRVEDVAIGFTETVDTVFNGAEDYAMPADRKFVLGTNKVEYVVGTDSKQRVGQTRAYAESVAKQVKGYTAGRPELLRFIADYAVRDSKELETLWREKGMAESNAYRRATTPQ